MKSMIMYSPNLPNGQWTQKYRDLDRTEVIELVYRSMRDALNGLNFVEQKGKTIICYKKLKGEKGQKISINLRLKFEDIEFVTWDDVMPWQSRRLIEQDTF